MSYMNGSGGGLVPNKHKAITWSNHDITWNKMTQFDHAYIRHQTWKYSTACGHDQMLI